MWFRNQNRGLIVSHARMVWLEIKKKKINQKKKNRSMHTYRPKIYFIWYHHEPRVLLLSIDSQSSYYLHSTKAVIDDWCILPYEKRRRKNMEARDSNIHSSIYRTTTPSSQSPSFSQFSQIILMYYHRRSPIFLSM